MVAYIRSIGIISPQNTWGNKSLHELEKPQEKEFFSAIEPNYEDWLNVRSLRRMSRILKMGVTSALMALREAGIDNPDAIITGTGYGCLEDTGTFLSTMINLSETSLNPTPFIQSTHNSIGSAVALLYDCRNYNQTYSQGPVSFECSLIDALLLIREQKASICLVGAVDELTEMSSGIMRSFKALGERRKKAVLHPGESASASTSCVLSNGEGAAYFVLSATKNENDTSCIADATTFFEPDLESLQNGIASFLRKNQLTETDIDLILLGTAGEEEMNTELYELSNHLFPSTSSGHFKHLCGEYHSASSFGTWLASRIICEQYVPPTILIRDQKRKPKNILILNQSGGSYFSLILLMAC